jgi:hypothetical protein
LPSLVQRFLRYMAHRRGRRQLPPTLAAGDVCSVRSGSQGKYAIAKVLVRDPAIVHVRVYKEWFPSRPQRIETAALSLGSIHDPDGFGMGHLPLSEGAFGLWEPIVIHREPVTEDELDGYQIWKESRGGVWE